MKFSDLNIPGIVIALAGLVGAYFAARRGDRATDASSRVQQLKNQDDHQLAIIQETRLTQQEALHDCTERLDKLEARIDQQDAAHQEAVQRWADERATWEEEKRSLRHDLVNLKVTVKASSLIIERQDAELTYWRERANSAGK